MLLVRSVGSSRKRKLSARSRARSGSRTSSSALIGPRASSTIWSTAAMSRSFYALSNTISQVVRTPANCAGCLADLLQLHFDPTIGTVSYVTPDIKAKFSTPAPGAFSNVGRNAFRLAGYKTMNLSIGKKTRITERQSLETRLEIQNVTNSEEYDQMASNIITNPAFGN